MTRALVNEIGGGFVARLDPEGRLNLAACLQCGKCSSGCTMREETDILPHQLGRMALLGLEEHLLSSRAIWLCVSCHTCVARCPMKVDTPALIDRLRELRNAEPGAVDGDVQRVRIFNDAMLGSVRRYGRVHDFGLMGAYKLKSRDLMSDLRKLPAMLRKGKLRILPPRTRGRKAVRAIFSRLRQSRRAGQ